MKKSSVQVKRARYLSLNVKLGLATSSPIKPKRIQFHEKVVRLVYGQKKWSRVGPNHTSPSDNDQIASNTAHISQLVNTAIGEAFQGTMRKLEVILVDFSNNKFDLLREPILMQLVELFHKLVVSKVCNNFILLLPELPAKETASIQYFRQDKSLPKPFKFAIISNAGDSILIPKKGWKLSSIERRYSVLIRALEEEASKSFKSKIVRRLGHFRRAKNSGGCRLYSYTTDNCVDELKELIREWWSAKRIKSTAIIYDSVNNPSLTEAIQSFSVSKKLFAERLDDVVSHPHLAAEASSHDPCLLVLDVIETGDTFLGHVEALKALDIKVDKEVLAAIAKGGNKQATIGGFSVTAFALKPREPGGLECAQCRLGLPLTSDDRENFWKLRSYDIWEMASKVGWEPEQDIPNVGDGYEIVPKFEEMLLEYGDWIAYKMEKLYTDFKHTDNFFVIHPEEGGANKVSEKLQLRFKNKLSVIKVPRPAIEMAQVANNAWQTVIDEWEEERIWIDQLNSLGEASAIITDIFNASGSTFGSLLALLKHFEISAFCYFPVVDRDCGPDLGGKYQNILRYSLYDWYGPRVLNRVRK